MTIDLFGRNLVISSRIFRIEAELIGAAQPMKEMRAIR